MPKTGNIFLDFLSFVSAFFPLIVSAAILLRKKYRNDVLNFLMIICLLSFIKNLLLFIITPTTITENIISNIFSLIEFVFLVTIFKNFLSEKKIRNTMNILFSIFLSAVITIYFSKGIQEKIFFAQLLFSAIIILASILCIGKITSSGSLHIFNNPLFWIAAGSLFYFITLILLQSMAAIYESKLNESVAEKQLLLNIANIIRYFFYMLAAFFFEEPKDEEKFLF